MIHEPILERRQKRAVCVRLQPRHVPTAREGDILEMRDLVSQQVSGRSAGMRIIIAVKHEHRRRYGVEPCRLETFPLKSQNVPPGLLVAATVHPQGGLPRLGSIQKTEPARRCRPSPPKGDLAARYLSLHPSVAAARLLVSAPWGRDGHPVSFGKWHGSRYRMCHTR